MSAHRAVLLVLLVVGGSLAVAAPTSAAVDSRADPAEQNDVAESGDAAETGDAAATDTDAGAASDARLAAVQRSVSAVQNDSGNSSLGGDISSFMQSSAAEIGGAVETGMWSAEFNATTNRSRQRRLVELRTDDLRAELNDLQERKQELVAERDSGNVSDAAYKAQIGRLLGRINALRSAINATEPRAKQVDTNVDALQMLESDTENLTGPEIAAIARNTTGVGNGNGSSGVGGAPEGVGNGNGPLEDAGNGSGTGTAGSSDGTPGGSPADVGNGNDTANGTPGVSASEGKASIGNDTAVANGTAVGNADGATNESEQGPPADAPMRAVTPSWTTGPSTGPQVGAFAGHDSAESGSVVGLHLTIESLGLEPISTAMSVRSSTVPRVLPFA